MSPGGAAAAALLLSAAAALYAGLWREGPAPGLKELVLLGGRCFLFLALLTLAISVASPWLSSTPSPPVGPTVPNDEKERQQRLVRTEQQEALREQARGYLENVLRPRQESRLKKQEERFYQLTGESWKLTGGHKLGSDEDSVPENANLGPGNTPNQEALRRRRLPEPPNRPVPPIEQPGAEKVPILPEEPPEQANEVVTVALRGPSGRILRRRFLKSCSSQVLLAWMVRAGYPSSTYTLCTPYPRRALPVEGGRTLEDLGITVGTVLNVEEREPASNCGASGALASSTT
ncbi:UBX domain-containing protein 8 [Tachyglossus aculeatus]|uniref:UBX domain-containing protein 8 n=1 Tax=Tachyglossus aculeatus TaxID=9261 RepID=UPI0018F4AE28|nr:UBX domain-containing protein 8 [Tachyglossus aculeatus]